MALLLISNFFGYLPHRRLQLKDVVASRDHPDQQAWQEATDKTYQDKDPVIGKVFVRDTDKSVIDLRTNVAGDSPSEVAYTGQEGKSSRLDMPRANLGVNDHAWQLDEALVDNLVHILGQDDQRQVRDPPVDIFSQHEHESKRRHQDLDNALP